jgi:hypothetical protein
LSSGVLQDVADFGLFVQRAQGDDNAARPKRSIIRDWKLWHVRQIDADAITFLDSKILKGLSKLVH